MPRVAGIDPGTVSFDLCVLENGEPVAGGTIATPDLAADPAPLVDLLRAHAPLDLVLGPAGYGLPLVPAERVGEAELAQIVLVRAGARGAGGPRGGGIGGMRAIAAACRDAGLPLVFGPGVIHLPTVPEHRKWNRADMGTADKVASAALGIADQARRLGAGPEATSFLLLELGGAFSAALAVNAGQIVDGLGGSSGPIGARAAGALDGEVAHLLGDGVTKAALFSGGALDPRGERDLSAPGALAALRADPALADGWAALEEGAAKAALALGAVVRAPREILVSGRVAAAPGLLDALAARLEGLAPVRELRGLGGSPAGAAAQGAAVLADGLAGGRHAALVERLRLREATGTALDHLRLAGAERITLG